MVLYIQFSTGIHFALFTELIQITAANAVQCAYNCISTYYRQPC